MRVSDSPFRQSLNAIGLATLGWFFFCLCDVITKFLSQDYNVIQIIATISVTGCIITGGWIIVRHGWRGFITPNWKWYVFRGCNVIGASFFLTYSLSMIPLADFYGIVFLTPMLTTLIAVMFLKEKIGIYRWMAIIAGFIGVLIIIGPSFQERNLGYLYALVGSLFASSNALIFHKIGREPVAALYGFVPFVANLIYVVPLFLGDADFRLPTTAFDWTLFLIIAPLSFAGLLGYSIGFARAPSTSLVAPFHYSQMLWGALLGFLVFGDVPGLSTVAGSIIIIAAGMLVIWREHVLHLQIATTASKNPL